MGRNRASCSGWLIAAPILLVVYTAFSTAVIGGSGQQVSVAHWSGCWCACGRTPRTGTGSDDGPVRPALWASARDDEITIVFCGSKKCLVTGASQWPMCCSAAPNQGIIVLPLMVFHQMQLMVCAWLAQRYAASHPR